MPGVLEEVLRAYLYTSDPEVALLSMLLGTGGKILVFESEDELLGSGFAHGSNQCSGTLGFISLIIAFLYFMGILEN